MKITGRPEWYRLSFNPQTNNLTLSVRREVIHYLKEKVKWNSDTEVLDLKNKLGLSDFVPPGIGSLCGFNNVISITERDQEWINLIARLPVYDHQVALQIDKPEYQKAVPATIHILLRALNQFYAQGTGDKNQSLIAQSLLVGASGPSLELAMTLTFSREFILWSGTFNKLFRKVVIDAMTSAYSYMWRGKKSEATFNVYFTGASFKMNVAGAECYPNRQDGEAIMLTPMRLNSRQYLTILVGFSMVDDLLKGAPIIGAGGSEQGVLIAA